MCVDFPKLNIITVKDKYPLPLINDQIDRLGSSVYFTGLDLALRYYQVPMANDSIEKVTFVIPDGHFRVFENAVWVVQRNGCISTLNKQCFG